MNVIDDIIYVLYILYIHVCIICFVLNKAFRKKIWIVGKHMAFTWVFFFDTLGMSTMVTWTHPRTAGRKHLRTLSEELTLWEVPEPIP